MEKTSLTTYNFVSDTYFIYVGHPCSNLGNVALYFERIALICNITKIFLQIFLAITGFSKRINTILLYYRSLFFQDVMLRLYHWISLYSSFNSTSRVDSSSKQCTKCCAILRTVLPRGEPSDNTNLLIFFFRMH